MVSGMVSIVIPVYNVEKYLNRCISSVVNQTYKNLEIILVDDGSPDACPSMCDEWARKDKRIRVIHKKNEGLGFARNTGIENARGEFICFFDSDDYVESTTVEECYRMAKDERADIIYFGHDDVTPSGGVLRVNVPSPPKQIYEGTEIIEVLVPKMVSYDAGTGENWRLSLSAWSSMIAMRLIHRYGWRFVSEREIISEDYYSMLALYQHVRKVVFLRKVFYHYTINPSSLSRGYRKDRYEKLKYWAVSMKKLGLYMNCEITAEVDTCFCGMMMGALKQIAESKESIKAKRAYFSEIVNDEYLHAILRNGNFSGDGLTKRILYWCIRTKSVTLCYLLCIVRNLKG